MRAKYAEVYGLRAADVKFEFDGEAVKDSHTPGLLGMEDDNMIDVKVGSPLNTFGSKCKYTNWCLVLTHY